jgi:opacity protein-like surface antigen
MGELRQGEVTRGSKGRLVAAGLIAVLAGVAGAFAADKPEDAAQAAAESWLKTVDAGDYAASWSQASAALKAAVKQPEWGQVAAGIRTPLGKVVSRKVKSREYTENGPTTRVIGGRVYSWSGRGKCVILQFETAFANKASATETVIPVPDPDGVWRVSAYSVR